MTMCTTYSAVANLAMCSCPHQNHIANVDREKIDNCCGPEVEIKRGELPEDLNERFTLWMTWSHSLGT